MENDEGRRRGDPISGRDPVRAQQRQMGRGAVVERRSGELAGRRWGDHDRRRLSETLLTARHQERRAVASAIRAETLELLSSCQLQLSRLRSRLSDPDHLDGVARIDETLRAVGTQMRRLGAEPRPPVLGPEGGLCAALARYAAELGEASGEKYRVWSDLAAEPAPDVADALYLLAQAALALLRFRGEGTVTDITMTDLSGGILLTVGFAGEQFAATPEVLVARRVALHEMQEFAGSVGGWCEAEDDEVMRVIECWVPAPASGYWFLRGSSTPRAVVLPGTSDEGADNADD